MTTVAAQVTALRRMLVDRPIRVKLTVAITDTTTETFTTSAAHAQLFGNGDIWEHDDGSGERRYVTAVDTETPVLTALRGHDGSTAATHLIDTFMVKDPRYPFDTLSQAINECLEFELYPDVYEIVEHQVTSNLPEDGYSYNAPSAACEEWLDVYQVTSSNDAPTRTGITYTVRPQNVDTALWTTGKVFEITGGKQDGTEIYYVSCKHRLSISTILARQERLLQYYAAAWALDWSAPRRLAGPTNQGDRSVRPTDPNAVAARYFARFEQLKKQEAAWLRDQVPSRKLFNRGKGPLTYGV